MQLLDITMKRNQKKSFFRFPRIGNIILLIYYHMNFIETMEIFTNYFIHEYCIWRRLKQGLVAKNLVKKCLDVLRLLRKGLFLM